MSIEDTYVDRLRQTRTYAEQLVTIRTSEKFRLSSLPKADQQQHILIMEIHGSNPSLYTILTERRPGLSIGESLLHKFLCIIVEMNTRKLTLSNQYYLKDRRADQIKVSITIRYKVVDAKTLIVDNQDAVAELEELIDSTVKKYLDRKSSANFDIADLQTSLENEIERATDDTSEELGLEVKKITASIKLTEEQAKHFGQLLAIDRQHEIQVHEATRAEENERLVTEKYLNETRFRGVPLMTIAGAAGPTYVLNFYTMERKAAMQALITKIDEITSGKNALQKIEFLKELGADITVIEELRAEIIESEKANFRTTQGTTQAMYNILGAISPTNQLPGQRQDLIADSATNNEPDQES